MTDNKVSEEFFFEKIQESRGDDYYVDYQPPQPGLPYAVLNITITRDSAIDGAKLLMEREARQFLSRHPIPLIATSFDLKEATIKIQESACNNLAGWISPASGKIVLSWKSAEFDVHIKEHPIPTDVRSIYPDVPYKTKTQVKESAQEYAVKQRKYVSAMRFITLGWLVVIPASWSILEYFGPEWLGATVFAYSLWKAFQSWRKLTGKSKLTDQEALESERERKMRHYFHHCERNPRGFATLVSENLSNDIIARNRVEAEALRARRGLS